MTKNEALTKWVIPALKTTWNEKKCEEVLKALKQEPCDDAISRQALLDAFDFSEKTRKWGGDHSGYNTMMLYEIQDMIESAPPVNPQPKTGHWIYDDECKEHGHCSECGHRGVDLVDGAPHNYCPSCGAKMESEVQE